MGYGQVQESSTYVLGVPAGVQTAFMIENAWERILPSAEREFLRILDRLDFVEHQVEENQENLAVKKLSEIEMNDSEFEKLMQRYMYWQGKLANMLQVPPNPYDQRPILGSGYNGAGGMNVPVLQ
jgi:hypothetical protein